MLIESLALLHLLVATVYSERLPPKLDDYNYLDPGICEEPNFCIPYFSCEQGPSTNTRSNGSNVINLRNFGDLDDEGLTEQTKCTQMFEICCTVQSDKPQINSEPPPSTECGKRNRKSNQFTTVGGTRGEAQFGEFPWMVVVLRRKSVKNEYLGGGSLIHPRVVLTIAHKLKTNSNANLMIRAGEWNTQVETEPIKHQTGHVSEVVIHPQFNNQHAYNDVALLFLTEPLQLTATVNTICLPPADYVFPAGNKCVSTGWGTKDFENPNLRVSILKAVEMQVISNAVCENRLRLTRLGRRFDLHSSFMCAGGERDADMCTGDGGSPLACPLDAQSDSYYLAGMVSWGIGCHEGNPGVYADVAVQRNWIEEQLENRRINED